jgi:hypothetical protein
MIHGWTRALRPGAGTGVGLPRCPEVPSVEAADGIGGAF